jgi:hypothetical protein
MEAKIHLPNTRTIVNLSEGRSLKCMHVHLASPSHSSVLLNKFFVPYRRQDDRGDGHGGSDTPAKHARFRQADIRSFTMDAYEVCLFHAVRCFLGAT